MKSILPLIALTLACAACAGEPTPERAQTTAPVASRPAADPAATASPLDVTTEPKEDAGAAAPVASAAGPDRSSSFPAPAPPAPLPTAAAPSTSSHVPEGRRIAPAELGPMVERGEAVLVDVRGDLDWAYRLAAGATHIPYQDLFARSVELPHEKLIALYCT